MNVLSSTLPGVTQSVAPRLAQTTGVSARPLNPLEHSNWDGMLSHHSQATVFHSTAWARVLHHTYGHSPAYFCTLSGGAIQELLPTMEVSSPLTGRRGVALPFTDLCPPLLGAAPVGESRLFDQVVTHAQERRWKYFELRGGLAHWPEASPSLRFLGHHLLLDSDTAGLFSRLDPAVRRAVRKAQQSGLRIEFHDTLDAIAQYYSLHCQTRRRHGLPPQPYRFFENIGRYVIQRGCGFVATAMHQGHVLASAVFLHFGGHAIYKYGASDFAFQNLRPNNLLMWESIKHCQSLGCRELHFGRTSCGQEGLRRFKLGFGAVETPITYARYHVPRAVFVSDSDRASGWFNHFFRRCPTPLLRLAGDVVYPHLS